MCSTAPAREEAPGQDKGGQRGEAKEVPLHAREIFCKVLS